MIRPWIILRSSRGLVCLMLEPPQIADGLQCLIRRLDRLAVELKASLRFDQRHQFLHRIDVAAFEKSLKDRPRTIFTGLAVHRRTRRFSLHINASTHELEPLRVYEVADLQ